MSLAPQLVFFLSTLVWATTTILPPNEGRTLGKPLPDVVLTDDAGRALRLDQFAGKPLIISPIFTSCLHTCTPITRSLLKATEQLRKEGLEFRVLSVSFDPDETQAGLARLRKKVGLPESWSVALGDSIQMGTLLEALDFKTMRMEEGGYAHPNLVAVVDPQSRLSSYVYGVDVSAPQLSLAVRESVGAAPWWYRFRYALFLAIFLATVVSIGSFVYLLRRRKG